MTVAPVDLQSTERRVHEVGVACTTLDEARHSGSTLGLLLAAKVRDREAELGPLHGTYRIMYEAALSILCRDSHTFVANVADAALVAFKSALRGRNGE